MRVIGIPYNDRPDDIEAAKEESVIFDDEGLLRNIGNAKHDLVTILLDEFSQALSSTESIMKWW